MAAAAAAEEPEEFLVDSAVWLACAVPLSRLPTVGSQVYYFPHGHAEQCPAPLPAPLPMPHLFPCTVTNVRLAVDAKTNEVFADISLQPGPHRGPPSSSSSSADDDDDDDGGNNINNEDGITYYAKQLTQSDANNGGGFSVPRNCADFVFPKLDLEADPPVQNLLMRDTLGNRWQFRHIYRGTPRRHLLTTGWSKFVNAKLLVSGDTVVFMRRPDGELLIGLRRAPRYPLHQPYNARARVPPEDVVEAARLAAEGTPFTVTYYPRIGAGEFVVPRKEVEDALACPWEQGMLVRMQVMEAEETRRIDSASGTVRELHAHMWRALEVDWDDSALPSSTRSRFLNGWQVQLVGYSPLVKRLCRIPDTLCSGDGSMPAAPLIAPQSQEMAGAAAILPAGMQGARHDGSAADVPSSSPAVLTTQLLFPSPVEALSGASEILDPDSGSPPTNSVNMRPSNLPAAVETRSIQLFGTRISITSHAVQGAADGSSEEQVNNEVPDGMVDENAKPADG